jgi:hypothetical protein
MFCAKISHSANAALGAYWELIFKLDDLAWGESDVRESLLCGTGFGQCLG